MDSCQSKIAVPFKTTLSPITSLNVRPVQMTDPVSPVNNTMEATQKKCFPEINFGSPQSPLKKKKLVLDLDGTLIATYDTKPNVSCSTIHFTVEGKTFALFVAARDGLIDFLSTLSEFYEIQLYTAGYKEFAEAVTREFDLDFYISKIFHRQHCVQNKSGMFIKNLSLIGADLDSSILIDNSNCHSELQPFNTLVISTFNPEEADATLFELIPFLEWVSKKGDLRPIHNHYEEYFGEETNRNRCAELDEICYNMITDPPKTKVVTAKLEEHDLEDDGGRTLATLATLPTKKTPTTINDFVKRQQTIDEGKIAGFSPEVRKKIAEFNRTHVF